MAIQSGAGGTVFTGQGIAVFRLVSLKGRIRMEKTGLKVSRGPSTRHLIAAEFGLKPRDSHDKFIAAIDDKLAELQPVVAAENAALQPA